MGGKHVPCSSLCHIRVPGRLENVSTAERTVAMFAAVKMFPLLDLMIKLNKRQSKQSAIIDIAMANKESVQKYGNEPVQRTISA